MANNTTNSYLANEYNNLDAYKKEQEDKINQNTANQVNLSNQQIDKQLEYTLSDYNKQLDEAKSKYSQEREQLANIKAKEEDNLALQRAASGDRGGVAQKQYTDTMNQYDQSLYDIDLQQANLEQELQQAITEAKATGDYQKLANQLELQSAQYEQLYNLASNVMQQKNSNAASLDSYNLQVQQIQQNAVLNKINSNIPVTEDDMAIFGLYGSNAKTAAENINNSQGVQRQILAEQLKAYQTDNGTETTDDTSTSYWSNDVPYSVAQQAALYMDSNTGLTVIDKNGTAHQVYFAADNETPTRAFQEGDAFTIDGYGTYVYNGDQFVSLSNYSGTSSGEPENQPGSSSNNSASIITDLGNKVQAAETNYTNLYNQLYFKYWKAYGGNTDAAQAIDSMGLENILSAEERKELSNSASQWKVLSDQYNEYTK